MEKFVSCTIKDKLTCLLAIIILTAIVIMNNINRIMPVSFDFLFGIIIFYSFKERFSMLYKYKIENNDLIIKKIFKTETYNFNDLEKVLFPVLSKMDTFVFKFSQKNINIFYDKNTSQLLEYFYENNIKNIYEKKKNIFENTKCFINISNELTSLYRKIQLFILFIISVFCSIDSFFERKNRIDYYILMVLFIFSAISSAISFFKSFKKIKHSDLENEYIDKSGFHLMNSFIPFSEVEKIVKVISKWGKTKLQIKTKKNEEYEISTSGFYGDILYEIYLMQKISIYI